VAIYLHAGKLAPRVEMVSPPRLVVDEAGSEVQLRLLNCGELSVRPLIAIYAGDARPVRGEELASILPGRTRLVRLRLPDEGSIAHSWRLVVNV
ncbi:hypothetical protein, partial [Staphylococcus aureus]|uniref:hypothetical protein n=1 Tax=Staphylococcus aureus TaxID=1280 RepID=UPI00301D9F8A